MKDSNNNGIPDDIELGYKVSLLVRIMVVVWSGAMLTITYVGKSNYDATFVASVFSGTLATFGIDLKGRDKQKQQDTIITPINSKDK